MIQNRAAGSQAQPSGSSPLGQFFAFLLAGGISSTISLVSRHFFNLIVPYEAAVVLAQLVGIGVAFSLSRLFVFANSGPPVVFAFGRFVLVNVLSVLIVAGVSSIAFRLVLPLLGVTFYPAILAQIIGLACSAVPSFLGHKYFSFR